MELVNIIATKLVYYAAILLCVHIFLDIKQANKKSVRIGIAVFEVFIPIWCIVGFKVNAVLWGTFVLLAFFIFEGSLLKKLWILVLTQTIWNGLKLFLNILLNEIVSYCISLGKEIDVTRNIIELALIVLLYQGIGKLSQTGGEETKESHLNNRQRICMIILATEANFIINVGKYIYNRQMDFFCGYTIISLFFATGGLFMVCFALSVNNSITKENYKLINRTLKDQIDRQFAYYQKLEVITKETRAIKHDMHNHLVVLKGLAKDQDYKEIVTYIDNLQCSLSEAGTLLQTGNSIVDAILNEKTEIAGKNNIDLSVDICLKQNLNITPLDLCIVLANSLDNAIEACEKIEEESNRHIDVIGRCDKGYLSFIISNTVHASVQVKNNKVVTDKEDKLNHGFGLQNISNCVKSNHGKLNIESTKDRFILYIDIPLKK